MMYGQQLPDTDGPKRNVRAFPYPILERAGLLDKPAFIHLEPQDVLTFIL